MLSVTLRACLPFLGDSPPPCHCLPPYQVWCLPSSVSSFPVATSAFTLCPKPRLLLKGLEFVQTKHAHHCPVSLSTHYTFFSLSFIARCCIHITHQDDFPHHGILHLLPVWDFFILWFILLWVLFYCILKVLFFIVTVKKISVLLTSGFRLFLLSLWDSWRKFSVLGYIASIV